MIPFPFRSLLDTFPAIYIVIDQQFRVVDISQGVRSILGHHPSFLTGKLASEIIEAADLDTSILAFGQLLAGKKCHGFINNLLHKGGFAVNLCWYGSVDPQTGLVHLIGQKTSFPSLLTRQSGQGSNPSAALVGEMIIDADWRISYANEAAGFLTDKTLEELIGHHFWTSYSDARGSIVEENFLRAINQNVPVRFEVYKRTTPQQWLEINTFPTNNGLSVFFRNINKEKKAQEEQWKLSLIARETNNLVLLTDAMGNLTWVNDAFSKTTGYAFHEAIGQPISTFLSGRETDTISILSLKEAIKKGVAFNAEVLQYSKEGKKLWVDMQGQPIKNDSGKVLQFFSIGTDITQRKQFEEQLIKEQKQRQQNITRATIEAQERERSMVSQELHDNVNQVLTTVKLYTELCLSGIEQRDELLRKSVQLLQQSINEIRSLSKRLSSPTLGKFRLRDSVKELTESIVATNKLEIETNISLLEDLEVTQEQHIGIFRILQEHFTNILKHAEADKVQVSFDVVNDELVLKVRDDGKGFDTKTIKNGIGIANMLSRAEGLKGSLTLNSAPGLGCVLLVRFPLS
jgi:PAS domain S-box-containing protein